MRLYFFNNMYFPGIQAGIQAGHAAVELMVKYPGNESVLDWAMNYKTFIILNGGDHGNLQTLSEELYLKYDDYPTAVFKEPGANNCISSVALLLPESIYELASFMRNNQHLPWDYNTTERQLADLINNYGLFR